MNKEFCLFKIDKKRVIWEVTKYCNYQCKHCCASANIVDTKDELNTKQCKDILRELKNFGVEEIYFSGGEPFSRNDILDILQTAKCVRAASHFDRCNRVLPRAYTVHKILHVWRTYFIFSFAYFLFSFFQ